MDTTDLYIKEFSFHKSQSETITEMFRVSFKYPRLGYLHLLGILKANFYHQVVSIKKLQDNT